MTYFTEQNTDAIFNMEDLARQETTRRRRKYQRDLYLNPEYRGDASPKMSVAFQGTTWRYSA
jgi:hypothetical protein